MADNGACKCYGTFMANSRKSFQMSNGQCMAAANGHAFAAMQAPVKGCRAELPCLEKAAVQ